MLDREEQEVAVELNQPVAVEHHKPLKDELAEAVQALQTVTLLLKGLYGQLNEEREVITLASGQMAHAVKQFEQHLIQFESFEKACKQWVVESLKTEMKQTIQETAKAIGEEVAESAYEPIKQSIHSLGRLSQEITNRHTNQKNSWRRFSILFLAGALLGGSIGGFIVHRLSSQTKEMKLKLALGEILMRSWGGLNKTEKEKMMTLAFK